MNRPLTKGYAVRSWRPSDARSLAHHANNRAVWRNLRDGFPHPYEPHHARAFLEMVASGPKETIFCIACEDEAVGGVGLHPRTDVERFTAEIGYWLGEAHWGKGVASAAVVAVTEHAFAELGLHRVFALPYHHNVASCRVLEKAGYELEGRMRASAFKDGAIVDQFLYAAVSPNVLRDDPDLPRS